MRNIFEFFYELIRVMYTAIRLSLLTIVVTVKEIFRRKN